jgi:hypothetical protein
VSLVVSASDGFWWRCDGCLQPITADGLALHRPLTGGGAVEALTVHKGCTHAPLVRALLPTYSSRPLRVVMRELDDTLAAEVQAFTRQEG